MAAVWETPVRVKDGMEPEDLRKLIASIDNRLREFPPGDDELADAMQAARIASAEAWARLTEAQRLYQLPAQTYFALERLRNRRALAQLYPDTPIGDFA